MKRLLILATLLIFTACTAMTESSTPTASPSPTTTATVTLSPTVTPSITPSPTATATASVTPTGTPTATQILHTPDFLALPIADNLLFPSNSEADCQLPCWQGLRVGVSDINDALDMFDKVFGLQVSENFFHEAPIESPLRDYEIPSTKYAFYWWDSPSAYFDITVLVDDENHILKGFQINYASREKTLHTPQQVIQQVGRPSAIFLTPYIGNGKNVYYTRLMLVYNVGMAFWFHQEATITEHNYGYDVNLCFDNTVTSTRTYFVEPFDNLEGDLDIVQTEWVYNLAYKTVFDPADQLVDMTVDEIVEVALQEENPCILIESR